MAPVTAIAHPNIALVKYWGKRDSDLNLPAVPSLSVTLDTFHTETTVTWGIDAKEDQIVLNGLEITGSAGQRVSRFLHLIRADRPPVRVVSDNNFPTAAGLASSSSGFAALALAATRAAGVQLSLPQLSVLARRGSGSACRSLWGGWVVWPAGQRADGMDSHGTPLASQDHWDVSILVATVSSAPKPVGSTAGMLRTQKTSPLYPGWVGSASGDLSVAVEAVRNRNLEALGQVMEHSTWKMHATMLSARPTLRYQLPETLAALDVVDELRRQGVGAWATMDAGPNVKVLCATPDAPRVADALRSVVKSVRVLAVGADARLV